MSGRGKTTSPVAERRGSCTRIEWGSILQRPDRSSRVNTVRENNVYRWDANLLSDLTDIRIDTPERIEVQ